MLHANKGGSGSGKVSKKNISQQQTFKNKCHIDRENEKESEREREREEMERERKTKNLYCQKGRNKKTGAFGIVC